MSDGYDLELDFDSLQPVEKRLRIGKTEYILREANGVTYSQYQSAQMRNIEMVNGKTRFLGSSLDSETVLLAGCLFAVGDKTDKNPSGLSAIPLSVIKTWPNRILEPLIKMTKEISGIKNDETVESLTEEKTKIEEKLAKLKGKDEENPTKTSSESIETGSV